jgi:hypothetical protein
MLAQPKSIFSTHTLLWQKPWIVTPPTLRRSRHICGNTRIEGLRAADLRSAETTVAANPMGCSPVIGQFMMRLTVAYQICPKVFLMNILDSAIIQ